MIRDFSTEDSLLVWYCLDVILRSLLRLRGSQQLYPRLSWVLSGLWVVVPAGEQPVAVQDTTEQGAGQQGPHGWSWR